MTRHAAYSAVVSWRTAVEAAVTAAVATALTLVVFGPIWSSLGVPLATGDMYPTYVNAAEFGGLSYPTTRHFGFPVGMDLNHTPNLDLTQNAFAHVVDAISGSPFTGINLLLFASFPVVAVLAYLLLRLLDVRGPLAISLAVAYTMIPFHFGRGLGHTYLATMYSAVTALTLAVVIGLGLVPRIARHPRIARRVGGWLALAAIVVVTAWSGLYYAAFALILGTAAIAWRYANRDHWRDLALGAAPVVALGLVALVGFVPALVTVLTDPTRQAVAARDPNDSVTFAGNLALALAPAPVSGPSVLGRYAHLVAKLSGATPSVEGNTNTNLGTFATTACAVVFLVGLAVLARRRRLRRTSLPLLAFLTVVVVAFFVPSSLNLLVANVLTAQIRAWNRLLPILLLLFVAGGAVVLARTRLNRTSVATVVVGLAVLAVVTVEQVAPAQAAYADGAAGGRAAVDAARAYAARLNAAVPGRCGVLQLPYVGYPEQGAIERLTDYEHFLQPLVNQDKDFSYGAVRGTPAAAAVADLGNRFSAAAVDRLVADGFCAVHVDRRGFTPRAWEWVNGGLRATLGDPVAVGADGVWVAYALPTDDRR